MGAVVLGLAAAAAFAQGEGPPALAPPPLLSPEPVTGPPSPPSAPPSFDSPAPAESAPTSGPKARELTPPPAPPSYDSGLESYDSAGPGAYDAAAGAPAPAGEPSPPTYGARRRQAASRAEPPSRGSRIGVEIGLGYAGGAALGLTGLFAGCAVLSSSGSWGCVFGAMGGLAIGAVSGISLGVYLGGRLRGGDGWYIATLGGEIVGLVAAGLIAEANVNSSLGGIALLTLPLLGAIGGYEATAGERDTDDERLALLPGIGPTADGRGAVFALAGSF